MVRPKLKYCSSIWDTFHQKYKNTFKSVQHRAEKFVFKDFRRHRNDSDMLRDINWKTLEDRRTISRLILLYKSVNNNVATNTDEHYTNHEKENIKRKMSSVAFALPNARKNCYKCSFTPRTVVEWNLLPSTIREAPSVDTFKVRMCSINLYTHFTRNKGA